MYGLRDYQEDAVARMKNGCILCGGVGAGKSKTALAYFIEYEKGLPQIYRHDLFIITTARKRDTKEWDDECYDISELDDLDCTVTIDSWNNIKRYKDVCGGFFIFDEDKVTGKGVWSKTFIYISKHNEWIMLSATPGDNWLDYMAVFVANGYFKNQTEFLHRHVIFDRWAKFPKVNRYVGTKSLERMRNDILVDMDFNRPTIRNDEHVKVQYDRELYKDVMKRRWNIFNDKPCESVTELIYVLREIVNSDPSRILNVINIVHDHKKVIIFYNFDYELEQLKNISFGNKTQVAEWNGHCHDELPVGDYWVYLVQYTAGAEGWNCITTDTVIFYSLNYSYKMMEQAKGRIDRMNTPYKDLYFYYLESKAPIDLAINRALRSKKKFNEKRYFQRLASREKHGV